MIAKIVTPTKMGFSVPSVRTGLPTILKEGDARNVRMTVNNVNMLSSLGESSEEMSILKELHVRLVTLTKTRSQ